MDGSAKREYDNLAAACAHINGGGYRETAEIKGSVADQRELTGAESYHYAVALMGINGDTDRARDHLLHAIAASAGGAWAHYHLAEAEWRAGHPLQVVQALDGMIGDAKLTSAPVHLHSAFRLCLRMLDHEASNDPALRRRLRNLIHRMWQRGGPGPEIAAPQTQADSRLQSLATSLSELQRDLQAALPDLADRQRDTLRVMARADSEWAPPFAIHTDHPVALDSNDHLHPRGTRNDNTRQPRFIRRREEIFRRPLAAPDLGCAGGGLVYDFLVAGHRAVGLEGSDYSLLRRRAEWRAIPGHVATCDITRPFTVTEPDGKAATFDVITTWEVLEHLPVERLPALFDNLRRHLKPDGLFVASVATFSDSDNGVDYHETVRRASRWEEQVRHSGLTVRTSLFAAADYARGSGNGAADWDVVANPERGFHIVVSLPFAPPLQDANGRAFPSLSPSEAS